MLVGFLKDIFSIDVILITHILYSNICNTYQVQCDPLLMKLLLSDWTEGLLMVEHNIE